MEHTRKDDIKIDELKDALDFHIKSQKAYEENQTEVLKRLIESNEEVKEFITRANPVVTAFLNISTAGDMLSKIIMWLAKILLSLGAILGAVYAVKEWIKK